MPVAVRFTAIFPKKRRAGITQLVRKEVDAYAKHTADEIIHKLQSYPPVPAGSTYQRTDVLKYSWRRTPIGVGPNIGYRVSSSTPYASLVHGTVSDPGRQWWVHGSHHWRTIAAIVEELGGHGKFRRDTQAIITRAALAGEI